MASRVGGSMKGFGWLRNAADDLAAKLPAGVGEEKVGVIVNPQWRPYKPEPEDTDASSVVVSSTGMVEKIVLPERKQFVILSEETPGFDVEGFEGEFDTDFEAWVRHGGVLPEPVSEEPLSVDVDSVEDNSVEEETVEDTTVGEDSATSRVAETIMNAVEENTPAPPVEETLPEDTDNDEEEYVLGDTIAVQEVYGDNMKFTTTLTEIKDRNGNHVGYEKESVDKLMTEVSEKTVSKTPTPIENPSGQGALADFYSYRVVFSAADQEFVGTVDEFPSLSHVDKDFVGAFQGIHKVVEDAIIVLSEDGTPAPAPLGLTSMDEFFSSVRRGVESV